MANEEFNYKDKSRYLVISPPDKDGDIDIELENHRESNSIYLPRSKAIELRDWLTAVLRDKLPTADEYFASAVEGASE